MNATAPNDHAHPGSPRDLASAIALADATLARGADALDALALAFQGTARRAGAERARVGALLTALPGPVVQQADGALASALATHGALDALAAARAALAGHAAALASLADLAAAHADAAGRVRSALAPAPAASAPGQLAPADPARDSAGAGPAAGGTSPPAPPPATPPRQEVGTDGAALADDPQAGGGEGPAPASATTHPVAPPPSNGGGPALPTGPADPDRANWLPPGRRPEGGVLVGTAGEAAGVAAPPGGPGVPATRAPAGEDACCDPAPEGAAPTTGTGGRPPAHPAGAARTGPAAGGGKPRAAGRGRGKAPARQTD